MGPRGIGKRAVLEYTLLLVHLKHITHHGRIRCGRPVRGYDFGAGFCRTEGRIRKKQFVNGPSTPKTTLLVGPV